MYHKLQLYNVWFLRYGAWWTEPFLILDHFLPFYPINNLQNQNFEKMKKTPWDIIIHHFPQVYKNSWSYARLFLIYGSNFCFQFWAIFLPFILPNDPKTQNFKKWQKCLEISFYTFVPKIMLTWSTVPEIWCATDRPTEGWTDGETDGKSDIWRWMPRLKIKISFIRTSCIWTLGY